MSADTAADVAVIGLGGLGSAAACWAARMGARVVGLEQFPLGHDRGGSHDHSRLIRLVISAPLVWARITALPHTTYGARSSGLLASSWCT